MKALIGVTGATGYVGGRLVPRLLEAGYRVRCLARDPRKLEGRPWRDQVEVAPGDVLDPESLLGYMEGLEAVYYLVHSMAAGEQGFEDRDRIAAENTAFAADRKGVKRIIYLGGLGERGDGLSRHLESRLDTGRALRSGNVPVTELRAAVIVGSGSMSFEMIRSLVERLPAMITPKWVNTRCQPIAISDVLRYLVGCLEVEATARDSFDIGGADVLTYKDMMLRYAHLRGLRRFMIPVPVLTPRLSSYWIDLVTPIPASYARPLVEGLKNEVVVKDQRIRKLIPFEPLGYEEAVRVALQRIHDRKVETRWTEARLPYLRSVPASFDGREFVDLRSINCSAPQAAVWRSVSGIGGDRGWYAFDLLWDLRGLMDRLVGGVGMRRGRRDPDHLRPGDALDFWRVVEVTPEEKLILQAEMKVPGLAWLEFDLEPDGSGTKIVQRARFWPTGVWGGLYWYPLLPVHAVIFRAMLRAIARRAEELAANS